ncbi:hypothetical protein SAMN05216412_11263 [Nitrosospira multiformis]|uniref:Uncharacterized protein n=1 Tax=Nitrosospira multiformis TaxID=1231 RepID=A0A1I0GCK0_9PROT|nr:hypothetical protein SAMN05216412_11263 [Nitrosospira multiformis]
MSSKHTGVRYSLSHMVLERARIVACIPAKLRGVGVSKSLALTPLERARRFAFINRNKKGKK